MTVVDMNAATGWYTEILARAVGPTGHVIAHNHPGARAALAAEDFEARYGGNRLPNVEQTFVRHNDLHLPASSVDVVLMSMVYHDTYWHDDVVDWGPIDRQALLASLLEALKPGGIVGRHRSLRRGRQGSVRVRDGRAPHRSRRRAPRLPRRGLRSGRRERRAALDDRRLFGERLRRGRRRPHGPLRPAVPKTGRRATRRPRRAAGCDRRRRDRRATACSGRSVARR